MPFSKFALCFDASTDTACAESFVAEARVLSEMGTLDVVPIMAPVKSDAKNRPTLPKHIAEPLAEFGIDPIIAPYTVNAETIIWHDPACLKSIPLRTRYVAKNFLVVTDSDFTLQNGVELFEATERMAAIADAVMGADLHVLPVSQNNRSTLSPWHSSEGDNWNLSGHHWPQVINREVINSVSAPSDRRGSWFGTGRKHYPSPETLWVIFPESAEHCGLVGGADFLGQEPPGHWSVFHSTDITQSRFLRDIDFYLGFANPFWRGNDDQMIATAIASGKVVIADPCRAAAFGDGVIAAMPSDVDAIINRLVTDANAYQKQVAKGQSRLSEFSEPAFKSRLEPLLRDIGAL